MQQAANHITLIWCQEVIYEKASCSLRLDRDLSGPWVLTQSPDGRANIFAAQWALVSSCRGDSGSLLMIEGLKRFARILQEIKFQLALRSMLCSGLQHVFHVKIPHCSTDKPSLGWQINTFMGDSSDHPSRLDGWMDGRFIDGLMDGWINKSMDDWADKRMDVRMDSLDGRMDAQMDG